MTAIRRTPPLAAALACAILLAAAGCGGDDEGEPIPAALANEIATKVDLVETRVNRGSCGNLEAMSYPDIEERIKALPKDTDPDVRQALEDSIDRLKELAGGECEEVRQRKEEERKEQEAREREEEEAVPVDSDGDGFNDDVDACPSDYAASDISSDGCPPPPPTETIETVPEEAPEEEPEEPEPKPKPPEKPDKPEPPGNSNKPPKKQSSGAPGATREGPQP